MMLTDEMIKKQLEKTLYKQPFKEGAKFARGFYEIQKCETCNTINICTIRKFVRDNIDLENFGCTEWEPENEIN